jgi:hypothetical protein
MAEKTRQEELFDEYKKRADEVIKSASEDFDRNLLTLSSGALGLSLAFIKDIVPLSKSVWIPCLVVSWGAFALCVLITLASSQVSVRANEIALEVAENVYINGQSQSRNKHRETIIYRAITWCMWGASLCFLVGLVCTLLFAGMNIREAKKMADLENKVVTSELQKSVKPSTMTPCGSTMSIRDSVKPAGMTPAPAAQQATQGGNSTAQPSQPSGDKK